MSELIRVGNQAILNDQKGVNIETERRLRVLLLPVPYLHSGDIVPDSMRYAVLAEPPLTPDETEAIRTEVASDEELDGVLRVNIEERFGQTGFTAVHGGVQRPHLERAAKLAGYAASALKV